MDVSDRGPVFDSSLKLSKSSSGETTEFSNWQSKIDWYARYKAIMEWKVLFNGQQYCWVSILPKVCNENFSEMHIIGKRKRQFSFETANIQFQILIGTLPSVLRMAVSLIIASLQMTQMITQNELMPLSWKLFGVKSHDCQVLRKLNILLPSLVPQTTFCLLDAMMQRLCWRTPRSEAIMKRSQACRITAHSQLKTACGSFKSPPKLPHHPKFSPS